MQVSNEDGLPDKDDDSDGSQRRAHLDAGRSLPPPRRRGLGSALIKIARGRCSCPANVIVAASRVADQDQLAFRLETREALGQVLHGELPGVALVVDRPRDLASINHCHQGDPRRSSVEALQRRAANRTDPGFVGAVGQWWRWLPKAPASVMTVVTANAAAAVHANTAAAVTVLAEAEAGAAEAAGSVGGDCGGEAAAALRSSPSAVGPPTLSAAAAAEADVGPPSEPCGGGGGGDQATAAAVGAEGVDSERSVGSAEGRSDDGGSGAGTTAGGAMEAEAALEGSGASSPAGLVAQWPVAAAAGGGGGGLVELGGGGAGISVAVLDEPIYSAMVVVITWALLPRFGIRVAPEYDPSQDWLDDNEGQPFMDFKHFCNAMFDLADVWSAGVEAAQYVDLLVTLFRDVQQLEASQAAFTRLLHRFRSAKRQEQPLPQQPHAQQQHSRSNSPDSHYPLHIQPPSQPDPHPYHHPGPQPVPAGHSHSHSSETLKPGPSYAAARPDPRLPPCTAAVAAATTAPPDASGQTQPPSPPPAPAPLQLAARPLAVGGSGGSLTTPGGPHRMKMNVNMNMRMNMPISMSTPGQVQAVTAVTPTIVTFPARAGSAASQPLPYRLSGSASRTTSPAPGSEGPYGSRDATFQIPPYSRADVSGTRSTLAEYLRSGAPRPDRATLEQWRRSRGSSGRRGGPGEGRQASAEPQSRVRAPAAVALSAELLLGPPGGAGRRDGGDGAVLMYEEYMHDMAARYLAQQQKLLVASSAAAAAAAGQLLAAAAAAATVAATGQGWEGANGAALTPTAASAPVDSSVASIEKRPSVPQPSEHQPHLQQQLSYSGPGRSSFTASDAQRFKYTDTNGAPPPPPPPSPPPGGTAAAAAAALDCTAESAFATYPAAAAAAVAAATSSPEEWAPSTAPLPQQPRPPALAPPPPPPLPSLPVRAAPTIDFSLMAYMQQRPVCVVGHAVQASEPQPTGSGGGGGNAAVPTPAGRVSPFRRLSRSRSPASATAAGVSVDVAQGGGARGADATAPRALRPQSHNGAPAGRTAPLSARPRGRDPGAAATVGAEAAAAIAAAALSAAGQQSLGGVAESYDAVGTYARAQAQAEVVVAFAAAAYRLADPHVHSLLLPARLSASASTSAATASPPPQGAPTPPPAGATTKSASPPRGGGGGGGVRGGSPPSARGRQASSAAAAAAAAAGGSSLPAYLSGVPQFGPAPTAMSVTAQPDAAAVAAMPYVGGGLLPPPTAYVSPPSTPGPSVRRRPCTASHSSRTSANALAAAAAAAVGASASGSLGNAVTRRFASAAPSRVAAHSSVVPSTPRPMGQWPPGNPGGEVSAAAGTPQLLSDSVAQQHQQRQQQLQQQQQQQQQHFGMAPQSVNAAAAAAATAVTSATSSLSSSPTGAAAAAMSSRWASSAPTWSTGPHLVQTPRSALRPSGTVAAAAAAVGPGGRLLVGPWGGAGGVGGSSGGANGFPRGPASGGSFVVSSSGQFASGGGSGGGSGHWVSAAPGAYGSAGGGPRNGATGVKLRTSYSSPAEGAAAAATAAAATAATAGGGWAGAGAGWNLPPANGVGASTNGAASAASSRRGSRSSGNGEEAAVAAAAALTTASLAPVAGEGPAGNEYGSGGGLAVQATGADDAARRRSHQVEYGIWNANASPPATSSSGSSGGVGTGAARIRIRSSEPVGFADAVTAARMNVAMMADELMQRQAEQRAAAKLMRDRAMQVRHLRPTTAVARHSFPNSFVAFLAAREAAGGSGGDSSPGPCAEATEVAAARSAAAVAAMTTGGHLATVSGA